MHIYIDESGDTGFKLDKGSSPIFSITIVIFNETKNIENIVNNVRRLEERLKLPPTFEWHFTKTSDRLRIEFLKSISDNDFIIRTVVMNKVYIDGKRLTSDKISFYNYTCKLLLQYASKYIQCAKIIFDKRGPNDLYTEMRKYFRDKCNFDHRMIKKIESRDSRKEKPLQVVDMIAGAIARSYSDKKNCHQFIDIIRHKIVNIFTFPDDLKR